MIVTIFGLLLFALIYILCGMLAGLSMMDDLNDYPCLVLFMWPYMLYKNFKRQFKEYMDKERKQKQ